jgi:enamine deaminase RidA (YjgF/YER057c/UK114 family)
MGIERYKSDMPFATISQITTASGPGKYAFIQGQLALDEHWEVMQGASFADQTRVCFAHIADALAKVGGTLENIVKLTCFVTDMDKFPEVNAVRAELLGDKLPVSTAVEIVKLYGGGDVEIEGIAFIPD